MKISIITSTYNSAETLRDTLESVLAQTHQDIEHIIVDGASTDGTVDLIREYEPRYGGRLKWTSEPDKGLYNAMNKGLAAATGDVVGILNSDDFYTSAQVLERLAHALESPEVEAVYGDVHYVSADDLSHCLRYYSSRMFAPWTMRLGFMPAHPSFYCRRRVYDEGGMFDTRYKVAADFELLLRLLFVRRTQTRYVPMDCVTMRDGGASNASLKSRMRIMRDHREALRRNHVRSCYPLLFLRYIYKFGEVALSRFHHPAPLPEYVARQVAPGR